MNFGRATLRPPSRLHLIILLAITASCAGASPATEPVVESDSAGIAIVNNDVTRMDRECVVSHEPDVVIGSAGGGPEYELFRVFGASQLSDGRIVLVNQGSHELRYYDAAGRHLRNAGRGGRGPGEFANAFQLWVLPGDTAWVGDYRPWQFLVFAPDGQWVRTVRPQPVFPNPPAVVEVLDDGRTLLATRPFPSEGENWSERHLTVVLHAPDGTVEDTIGTYADSRWGMLDDYPRVGLYPLFESFYRIDARGRTVVMGHGSQPEISVHAAGDGLALQRIVRWSIDSTAITRDDIAAERQRLAEPYRDMDAAMRQAMLEPLISEQRPVADRFPAFTSLRLGTDDRTWVRPFVKPTEPREQRWYVFSPDGRFECRARLPDLSELYELGADYVLGLQRDDLGIERVVKHSIGIP